MSYVIRYNNLEQLEALESRLLNKVRKATPGASIGSYGVKLESINGRDFALEIDYPLRPEIDVEITEAERSNLEVKDEKDWK